MTLKMLLAAAALAVTAGLVACGGGGGGGTAAAPTAVLKGTVTNAAGAPVPGADVKMGSATTQTQADGSFQLSVPNPGTSTVVLVKKTGFSTTAKTAPLAKDVTTQIAIQLLADQVITTFDAGTATTLKPNGATVTIPANAVQTAGGAAYTGTVNVAASYRNPDSVDGVRSFAEPYASADGARLQSVGVIEVKLTDTAGNPLQLKAGSPAELNFPASSVSQASTATAVPLWYYDETLLIWVRDGQATKQADGSFKGTVTHFTLWNADYPYVDDTRVKGCFVDAAGSPVALVYAHIRGTGFSASGSSDLRGSFEARVIPGIPLALSSAFSTPAFAPVAIAPLAPNEVREIKPCIVATNPSNVWVVPSVTSTFTVTLPSGTGTAAYAGNYIGTFSGTESGTFNVVIAANGAISGSVTSITTGPSPVSGAVTAGGAVSLTAGAAGAARFTGSITGNTVSGTWNYAPGTGLPGGGAFSGSKP